MYIGKIEETVQLLERSGAVFSELEKQQVALFAFKTGDEELVCKLIEELSEDTGDRKSIFEKYYAVTDVQERWIEQIETLLVSIEMLRLKEKQALDLMCQIVRAYEKDIAALKQEAYEEEQEEARDREAETKKKQRVL